MDTPANTLPPSIHAGCVLLGEDGVLLRGPSGSGKSTLARSLIAEAQRRRLFGRLVADDRTRLQMIGGRLLARPMPALAGLCEMRGLGILAMAHEPAAVVRLVVDCSRDERERLPPAESGSATILGITLPRITVNPAQAAAELVLAALAWESVHSGADIPLGNV